MESNETVKQKDAGLTAGVAIFGPPVAAFLIFWIVIGAMFFLPKLSDWYITSLNSELNVAWYQWPWSWPGSHIVASIFQYFGGYAVSPSEVPFSDFPNALRGMLAIVFNIFVAFLPLFAIDKIYTAVRWSTQAAFGKSGKNAASK